MVVGGQRHAPAALPRERPGAHCIGGWVGPRARGSLGSYGKKSPVTQSGIDPETVRLVAQYLNHYATPEPNFKSRYLK